ncbi:MAG: lactonase family protein [Bacteroidia bacterium]|nr:lactonase family protein [Bacteroidia bacterium]
MKKANLFIYMIFLIMIFATSCRSQPIRLFAGKYTEAGEKGLCLFDLNREEGTFKLLSESDAGPNPSYFCISKERGLIYAANEVMKFNGVQGGGVTALNFDARTGVIERVKELAVPNGGPCFISLSAREDFLFMANYDGGSVAVVKLDDNGIPERVTDTILFAGDEGKVSHAHMISSDPAGKKVYVTDLGLDRIVMFNFDPVSGRLQQIQNGIVNLTKGSGPRHFVFNLTGTKMYVICELNSTISVFNVDANGELNSIQTLTTLGEGFKGENSCADIHIGKNGEYLYGSNRGENTIVTFRIGSDGKLLLTGRTSCGGDWPRNFVIDPSGKFILVGNQKSGNISLFKIDEKTGIPIETGKDYKLSTPACLKFSDIE